MNPGYNLVNVRDFLAYTCGLENFCFFYRRKIEHITKIERPELDFDHLKGDRPRSKAQYLIDESERLGELTDLIFYLANFWFEDSHGKVEKYCQDQLHEDLCIAAQELWHNQKIERAIQAFEWLAKCDVHFQQEWEGIARDGLVNAPRIGDTSIGHKNLKALLDHLVMCREMYEQAGILLTQRQCTQARELYAKLEEAQPNYHDVRKRIKKVGESLSKCQQLHEQANGYVDAHEWLKALAAFQEVAAQPCACPDIPEWVNNPADVQKLQNLIETARLGYFIDDTLPWGEPNPYRLFQELDTAVTPNSSMESIQKAHRRLKNLTEEQQTSLKSLEQSDSERLFTDAFILPLAIPEDVVSAVEAFFVANGHLPPPETISEQYPGQSATLLYALGHAGQAAAIWEKMQQEQPLDARLAHCQGIYYWRQAAQASDVASALENWRYAISNWAIALADTAYWLRWGRQRYEQYSLEFVFTSVHTLTVRIPGKMAGWLKAKADQAAQDGDQLSADTLAQLLRELFIELAAVRLAQAIGGIAHASGQQIWFGPLRAGQQPVLAEAAARQIAQVRPDQMTDSPLLQGLPPEEALRRLRWYFSYLGEAAVFLDQPLYDPQKALEMLESVACQGAPDCHDAACPQHGRQKIPVPVCCPHWQEFASHTLAYRYLPEPISQLREDALHLAITAHTHLARQQFDQGEIKDAAALQGEWRKLLALAEFSQDRARIRERLGTAVLAATDEPLTTIPRLNTLINLLITSLNILAAGDQPAEGQPLKNRLAELLAQRGAIKQMQADMPGAEADLKQALAVAPHNHEIRSQLANTWTIAASESVQTDRFLALDYVRRATELLDEGETKYPGHDYTQIRDWIAKSRQNITPRPATVPLPGESGDQAPYSTKPPSRQAAAHEVPEAIRLYGRGVQLLREGKYEQSLGAFDEALKITPEDTDVQAQAIEALMARAWLLADQEKSEEALALVVQWQPKLPAQVARLQRQFAFLQKWCEHLFFLYKEKAFLHRLYDYQEVQLPFSGTNSDGALVRVQVEADGFRLTAALGAFPRPDIETVLHNLFAASSEIMLVKPCATDGQNIFLKSVLPFRLFTPEWFVLATLELSEFADLSPYYLLEIDRLRSWFRETRAKYIQQIQHSKFMPVTVEAVKKICRDKSWQLEEVVTNTRYEVTAFKKRQVQITSEPDGVRLAIRLGQLRQPDREMFAELLRLNAGLDTGKLSLDKEKHLILSSEWPYLDEPAIAAAFAALEQQLAELDPVLAGWLV
jgi:tetratricopeptide (TPR) repeat protein